MIYDVKYMMMITLLKGPQLTTSHSIAYDNDDNNDNENKKIPHLPGSSPLEKPRTLEGPKVWEERR